jgi:hypothetical protein
LKLSIPAYIAEANSSQIYRLPFMNYHGTKERKLLRGNGHKKSFVFACAGINIIGLDQ